MDELVESLPSAVLPSAVGDFESRLISGNTYLLSLRGSTPYITGAATLKYLSLPVPVRFLRIEFVHTDNVDAASLLMWGITISRQVRLSSLTNRLTLFTSSSLADRDCVVSFSPEDGIMLSGVYVFYGQNGVSTDRIYPFIYVEVL